MNNASVRSLVLTFAKALYREDLVAINPDRLAELSPPKGALSPMKAGLNDKPVGGLLSTAIQYIVALNSLNYRFWALENSGLRRYSYEGNVGAMGMRAAFNHAWGAEREMYPDALREALAKCQIETLFGDIPAPVSRRQILEEVLEGRKLEEYSQHLATKILNVATVTVEDAAELSDFFPNAYQDAFLKKAQLALAEVAGYCAENQISVTPSLTVFADYQVPRVLRALGVLEYSPALAAKVDGAQLLAQNGTEELAIRAATIIAGEKIASRFGVDPSVVDNYLWTHRALAGTSAFHLTETTLY